MVTKTPDKRIKVSILGASGYSGQELLGRLAVHGGAEVVHAFGQASAGTRLDELMPSLKGQTELVLEPFSIEAAAEGQVAFIALPSGEALAVVPRLLERNVTVIDLGGDFRLKDPSLYERYYGRRHPAPELLEGAVYGLTEWNRAAIAKAELIANPGCYPTSVLLPLLPLLKEAIIDSESISVSSMSGVSGAGRSAAPDLAFAEVNESVKAYKVGMHQHLPEMNTYCRAFAGVATQLNFVPHLLPITRGIYSTMFARLTRAQDPAALTATFQQYYGNEPFVRLRDGRAPEIKHVRNTNRIDIGFTIDLATKQVTLLAAIDNLVKGASGQAIQNFNVRYGFPETEGLL